DDVAAMDDAFRQDGSLECTGRRAVDELVDEQVVANQQVDFHRASRDLERLNDEGADEEREYHGNHDRLEILAQRRFLTRIHHSPTFSTARNASCGISTWPTRFMRFLPSFCFSRSLRLRV